MCSPSILKVVHIDCSPARQNSQRPHDVAGLIMTSAPGLMPLTPSPTVSTTPAVRAQHVWELVRDLESAGQSPEIQPVEGGGADAHRHLAGGRLGVGHLSHGHVFEAISIDRLGLH